jgi:hypothetical protein
MYTRVPYRVASSLNAINGGIYTFFLKRNNSVNLIPENTYAPRIMHELRLQQIDRYGQKKWPLHGGTLISSGTFQDLVMNSVQTTGDEIIVTYTDFDSTTNMSRLKAQRVDTNGVAQWGAGGIPISRYTSFSCYALRMFPDGNGGAYFISVVSGLNSSEYYLQRINSDGSIRWSPFGFLLPEPNHIDYFGEAIRTTSGNFVYVYRKSVNNLLQVYTQCIDTSGSVRWQQGGVRLFDLYPKAIGGHKPGMIPDDSGGVIISDEVSELTESRRKVRMQRLNADGVRLWGADGVSIADSASSSASSVLVSDARGGAIVVWAQDSIRNGDNANSKIFAQRVDADGNKLWPDAGVVLCSAPLRKYYPAIVSDGEGGAIVAWQDRRNTGNGPFVNDIYATRINQYGTAYPVELASFTARLEGEGVRLDWRTESEMNNAGFEIERTVPQPGATAGAYEAAQWQCIGYVTGNGSTNVHHAYVYHDALTPELLGQSELLYRLRQIDYDGTHEYSSVARVLVNPPTALSLEAVYPNPAQGSAVLRFTLPSEQLIRLVVYDVLGREVLLIHEGSLPTGVYEYEAHLNQLPAGLYHVLLTTPLGRQARRMVVTR